MEYRRSESMVESSHSTATAADAETLAASASDGSTVSDARDWTPVVSVILPTYNRSNVLPRAIDSVLAQTFEDFELIVVDDGSTDRTRGVLEDYEDDRIRCIDHSVNLGVSRARNTGLLASRGSYVAFLDADDVWFPRKLERQVTRLRDGSSDAVAAYCSVTRQRNSVIKQAGERLFSETVGIEGETAPVEHLLGSNLAIHAGSTLLFDRDAVSDLWFDPDLEILEDVDFLLDVLDCGRLLHVDEPLVELFETGYASASTEVRSRRAFVEKHAARTDAVDVSENRLRAQQEFFLAKAFFREGQFARGWRHLRRSQIPELRQLAGLGWSIAAGLSPTRD